MGGYQAAYQRIPASMLAERQPAGISIGRGKTQSVAGTGDPQLSHAELQCRPLHPETTRSTLWPAKNPITFLKNGQDMLSLGLFQGLVFLGASGRRTGFQIGQGHLQYWPC